MTSLNPSHLRYTRKIIQKANGTVHGHVRVLDAEGTCGTSVQGAGKYLGEAVQRCVLNAVYTPCRKYRRRYTPSVLAALTSSIAGGVVAKGKHSVHGNTRVVNVQGTCASR